MINGVIHWSVQNRVLVLLVSLLLAGVGLFSLKQTPVDAIPDLSDVQVIIKTRYEGQAPQVVQDQVTYPLSTALLSVPGAVTVRGFSFYGDSYVYVLFDDDTDLYWARARVMEYLNQARSQLPDGAEPEIGPDATGVGWVFLYALQDKTGQQDLSQLTSLQNWFLKFELQTLPGVAEVATVGGMIKQYQVQIDPNKLRAYQIPLSLVANAITEANQEVGASVIENAEAEYMLRVTGYIKGVEDLKQIPLGLNSQGTPVRLDDIANITIGPQMRRGVAELNGEGETVGGVVVMRFGENAQATIAAVKQKLQQLQASLPAGVEIVPVYDRSHLIDRAVDNLWHKLLQEFLMVAAVCALFLLHLRSSLVAIISIPLAVLTAFIVMRAQGINANIMSLGGIAIAIGAMIDGAIVLIENLHKRIEQTPLTSRNRWQLVTESAQEVGPALFFSLLIITVSFVPVFSLEAQEGRMFAPLAYTKTYAMAAAAALAITLVPVLMGYFIRGKIIAEAKNPVNRLLQACYQPLLAVVLRFPKITLCVALLLLASSYWPLQKMGSEFMPDLDEGDLMYMPTTYPGLSIGKARELLQQTDKLIRTVPEVESVFGKVGRANTATDPAPLTMIETFIQLKPKSEWRAGLTTGQLKQEFNALVHFPGLSNAWVMPIKTRIDMLATGIKTPIGIKVSGPDLSVIQSIGQQLENLLQPLDGVVSVYSERVASGRYINIKLNRQKAARYGLNIAEVQRAISLAVGGANISETIEGQERYPINLRYLADYRNSIYELQQLPITTGNGIQVSLADIAEVSIDAGPSVIKSENARLTGWTLIDIADVSLGEFVSLAQSHVARQLTLPSGYSIEWSGQYQYLARAEQRLAMIVPFTLAIITLLLFLNFRRLFEVALLLLSFPLALVGSLWFMLWMGFNFSVAVAVGMIALAGVAIETGVIMLVYLNTELAQVAKQNPNSQLQFFELQHAVKEAACKRLRPVLMTSTATIIGLLPILWGEGTGSEIMGRLAAPMVGGMLTTLVLTLFLLPVVYLLWHGRKAKI